MKFTLYYSLLFSKRGIEEMWSHYAADNIITLTSDNIKRLSLY